MQNYVGPESVKIKSMFSTVAAKYDRANNILSVGIHHLWRKSLVEWSGARNGSAVLDCATGTGDLAIEFKKAVGHEGSVIGTDFCADMLTSAPQKAAALRLDIKFETADVTALPFADASFDVVSISFGIRNVQDPVKALREMARVCKPGGRVMILEFGQPSIPVVREFYQFYSEKALPYLGGMITGNTSAYKYLQSSSARFPCGEEFLDLVRASGAYSTSEFRKFSFGGCFGYRLVAASFFGCSASEKGSS